MKISYKFLTVLIMLFTINSFGQIPLKKYLNNNLKVSLLIPSGAVIDEEEEGVMYTIEKNDIYIALNTLGSDEDKDMTTNQLLNEMKNFAEEIGISSNLKSAVVNNTKVYHTAGITQDEDSERDKLTMAMLFQSQTKASRRIVMLIETKDVNEDIMDAVRKISDSFVLTDNIQKTFDYEIRQNSVSDVSSKSSNVSSQKKSFVGGIVSSEIFKNVASMAKEKLANGNSKEGKFASKILGVLGF